MDELMERNSGVPQGARLSPMISIVWSIVIIFENFPLYVEEATMGGKPNLEMKTY